MNSKIKAILTEKGMTVKGEAEFESVKADSLEVEKAKVSDMKTAKISSPNTTLTVAAVIDALGVKGNVTTDSIATKTAGQPISVTGALSISGNVSLTGETAAVSAKSVATERLAYSKLSLKDAGFAKAPALYWIGIGNKDFLYKANVDYRKMLDEKGYKYEYFENGDGHIWRNWRIYLTIFAQRLFK